LIRAGRSKRAGLLPLATSLTVTTTVLSVA